MLNFKLKEKTQASTNFLSFENILIIWIFVFIALSLVKMLESIATPNSVNAKGEYL